MHLAKLILVALSGLAMTVLSVALAKRYTSRCTNASPSTPQTTPSSATPPPAAAKSGDTMEAWPPSIRQTERTENGQRASVPPSELTQPIRRFRSVRR